MSEVNRYGHIGYLANASDRLVELYPDMTVYVKASDYDDALSQLAASLAANESLSAELAWSENDSRDQSKEIAALREELADMRHWRDLALQFDNHRMNAMWHLKTLVSDGAHYDAARNFLSEPPVPASDLQQRLADAERRNELLSGLLREGLEEFKEGDDWIDRVIAALTKPEEANPGVARCMNCDRATVEQCDDAGCGFLGAGNGAPEEAKS